jgi:hypothetical protein
LSNNGSAEIVVLWEKTTVFEIDIDNVLDRQRRSDIAIAESVVELFTPKGILAARVGKEEEGIEDDESHDVNHRPPYNIGRVKRLT